MADYFVMNQESLKRFNTLRLDVIAHTIIIPYSVDGFVSALKDYKNKEIVIIGNGSNMLFTKEYYDDSTIFVVTSMLNQLHLDGDEIYVESGVRLNRLAWFACEQSLGGMEFCEDIPGTMGGALIMNAGQWSYSIGQYVNWIDVFNTETQDVERIIPEEGFFGYRYSRVNEMPVYILRAGLKTLPGDYNDALEKILYYRHERYVKQPRNFANAGSVFKRPVDKNGESRFVWKMFDACELRGFQIGGAQVSEKHPGFIVNTGTATVHDMRAVIDECIRRVQEAFDITLELEWRVI